MVSPHLLIRHRGKIIAGAVLIVCGVVALVVIAATALVALFNQGGSPQKMHQAECSRRGDSQSAGPTATGRSHKQQIKNTKMIAKTASKLDLPDRATLVALTAAAGESDMINVKHGDSAGPDSLGLFQQRKSWGSKKKRLDAKWATKSFLLGPKHDGKNHGSGETGLKGKAGWEALSVSAAIHAVQQNADPNHYTQYKSRAKKLAKQAGISLHGGDKPSRSAHTGTSAAAASHASDDYCDDVTKNEQHTDKDTGSGSVGEIKGTPLAKKTIKVLRKKLGTPYSFGGGTVKKPTVGKTSPAGWDCSSYLQMGIYKATGGKIKIARTTTQQMHDSHLKKVSAKHKQPGDLVFVDTDGQWGHVVMYLGHGKIIEEPHTGAKSRVKPLSEYDGKKKSLRRVKAADKDS